MRICFNYVSLSSYSPSSWQEQQKAFSLSFVGVIVCMWMLLIYLCNLHFSFVFSLCCCGRLMVLKQLRESELQRVIEDFWRIKQCFNIFRSGWELSRRLVSTWQLPKWSMLLWSRINNWQFKKTTQKYVFYPFF